MKKILPYIILLTFSLNGYCQINVITELTTSQANGGVNVNLKTSFGNVCGYIGNTFSIVENNVNVSVCYWSTEFLMFTDLENNFFIPLDSETYNSYIINVTPYFSNSQVDCDYIAMATSASTTFLKTNSFEIQKNKTALYPNPNNGLFNIILNKEHSKEVTVTIVDVLGKIVYVTTISDSNFEINIPNLPSGLYFAKLTSSDYTETIKFIKN